MYDDRKLLSDFDRKFPLLTNAAKLVDCETGEQSGRVNVEQAIRHCAVTLCENIRPSYVGGMMLRLNNLLHDALDCMAEEAARGTEEAEAEAEAEDE